MELWLSAGSFHSSGHQVGYLTRKQVLACAKLKNPLGEIPQHLLTPCEQEALQLAQRWPRISSPTARPCRSPNNSGYSVQIKQEQNERALLAWFSQMT